MTGETWRGNFTFITVNKACFALSGRANHVRSMEQTTLSAGKLWLVGAGPGDPDLLTLRAARLLESADLVVHDGLVGEGVLALIPADVTRISVAKQRSRHTMKQESINELLVRETLAGKQVVRLKGGDPFIFGRGGEELDAAREAGIAVEVVPGITAAAGCAAQAGLPLTHREDASAVSFVAGQCKDLTDQDWSGLAGHGRTLVIYMGLATASAIADKLIADGVSPGLPVAVVERGTTADARVLRTLLTDLGDLIARERVQSPALIIVGKVAARADALDCLGAPGVAAQIRDFT
ncbi:uroporphyrinogen-III C-methyltransferase [Sphingopyxis alaskensis RB2256]|jgi:uroporphyrin-III C-methyltransferase|uniref:uroporphyrinogen-III C-methyltransferase n=2 Tax=Sphingopyxis alaskensis TaxID=117207 RepID=Q1GV30_SPHAL|nr:uroporphyrinogen-III C-methyltransferase [Sphingopyxis alaskensis RB2256]